MKKFKSFLIKQKQKAHVRFLQIAILLTAPVLTTSAHASAFGKLITALEGWKTELYTMLGITSFIYVMWYAIQAKMERKQWSEVGVAVFQVAIVGGTAAAVPFAWSFFA
ncbi:hypothetical protein VII00023_22859 [Vibrio ichthyoenteri ATCC 700023]|uniref:Uncharacterized protein n=1 Tax=Vibrio ichthyoenteri ATCC 700023 TaxID=870968 RepID=F9S7H7_9VIBR|nr:TrbC/VirB2 family protein [Vibrio ichthyoenteri]EGU31273.1 hypothetical protein VII00023_22859 [Vibrio ichthyoenteri ATCC 700023]